MKILVVNCGSSSLKYQLFDMLTEEVLAKGLVERIGIEGSVLTHKPTGKEKKIVQQTMQTPSRWFCKCLSIRNTVFFLP